MPANAQAQTGATEAACGRSIGLGEGGKDMGLFVNGNADAGVSYRKPQCCHLSFVFEQADLNFDDTVLGKFDRIAGQIDQNLFKPQRIAIQLPRQIGRRAEDQLEVLVTGIRGHDV
eukprot:gene18467-biopygen18274